jgi:hypothetical protein
LTEFEKQRTDLLIKVCHWIERGLETEATSCLTQVDWAGNSTTKDILMDFLEWVVDELPQDN